jgi:hypothetical protein
MVAQFAHILVRKYSFANYKPKMSTTHINYISWKKEEINVSLFNLLAPEFDI